MNVQRRTSKTDRTDEPIAPGYNTLTEKASYRCIDRTKGASIYTVAEAVNEYYSKNTPDTQPVGDPYEALKASNRKATVLFTGIIAVFIVAIFLCRFVFHISYFGIVALLMFFALPFYIMKVKSERVRANDIFKKQIIQTALKRRYPEMEYRGKEQIHMHNIQESELFPTGNQNFGNDYCQTDDFCFSKLRLYNYQYVHGEDYSYEHFNGIFAMIKLLKPLHGVIKLCNLQRSEMNVQGLACVNQNKNFVCYTSSPKDYSDIMSAPLIDWLEFFSEKYPFNASIKDDAFYIAIPCKKDWFELGKKTNKEKIDETINADMQEFDEVYGFLKKISETVNIR